jgi:hypothetical protein
MKKRTKLLMFSLSALLIMTELTAQVNTGNASDHEVLQKYWYYRWRLRNDFLYIGDQPGESIPISDRMTYGNPGVSFGDATQLLGYYISTLATEHTLLTETNRFQDLPMTRTELYYAFKAFERLDYYAEPKFPFVYDTVPTPSPQNGAVQVKKIQQNVYEPVLDGFFMREDFPKEFFGDYFVDPCSLGNIPTSSQPNDHYVHLNNNMTTQGVSVSGTDFSEDLMLYRYMISPLGVPCPLVYPLNRSADSRAGRKDIFGDLTDPNIPGNYFDAADYTANQPSVDQINTLLQSFLLTKVSLPDYAIPVKLLDGTEIMVNFVQLAKDNSDRIISHLKVNNWKIERPTGEPLTQEHGGVAFPYAFPIAQIGNMIHDNNLTLPYYAIPSGYHTIGSVTAYKILWNSTKLIPDWDTFWNTKSDVMHWASTSCSWTIPYSIYNPASIAFSYFSRRQHNKNTVKESASQFSWDPFHMMLMGYLHGFNMNTEGVNNIALLRAYNTFDIQAPSNTYTNFTKDHLITAPCEGPLNFKNNGNPGIKGWNTSKRWHSSWDAQTNVQAESGFISGIYSGLDYMILHNLYYLNSNAQLPQYVNYIYRHYSENLSNNLAGNNPLTIAGYVSLTANNNIGSAMNVTYNASEEIHLTSGFHATSGAVFHAEVKPVLCGLDFRTMELPDSNSTAYGISEYTQRHIYADVTDKFEHLYQLPDSITMESLEERMRLIESGINPDDPNYLASIQYDIVITPIPAKDFVTITLNGQATPNLNYSIVNSLGKEVQNGVINYTEKIDVSGWSAGLYLFKVQDAVSTVTKKFMVE